MKRSRWPVVLCVLATVSSYGCDDNDAADDRAHRIGPSPISFNGLREPSSVGAFDVITHGVTLQPELAVPVVATSRGDCQDRPLFRLPFAIVGSGQGRSGLFIHEVEVRFVDRAGNSGGATTIAGPDLAARFGNTLLPAVGNRSFPLTLSFGCIGSAVGTLNVSVLSGDSRERGVRTSLSIDVH